MSNPPETPILWDPRLVLQLNNNNRCIGWAHSKRRGCAAYIKWKNKHKANHIIKQISEEEMDPVALNLDLETLVKHLLCPHHLVSQRQEMVDKWTKRMERFAAEEMDRQLALDLQMTLDLRDEMEELDRDGRWNEADRLFVTRVGGNPPPRPIPEDCTCQHVSRVPIEDSDGCVICSEGMDGNKLVWCKSGCGQSVHKACFADWKAECQTQGRAVTCVLCRRVWAPECECEGRAVICVFCRGSWLPECECEGRGR